MDLAQAKENLSEMEKALENARTVEEARPLLDRVGYTLKVVAEGQALHEAAIKAIDAQAEAEREVTRLETKLRADEQERDEQYELDRVMARRAFKEDPAVLKQLQLGAVELTIDAALMQIRALYRPDLDEATVAALIEQGLTPELRAAGWKRVNDVQQLRAQVAAAEALKKGWTEKRNAAIKAARAWEVEFRRAARKAFAKRPHLLTMFGIDD